MKRTDAKKRFNLSMPQELRDEIEEVAAEHETTSTEVVRKFTKLGLSANRAKRTGGAVYIRRDGNSKAEEIDIFGL